MLSDADLEAAQLGTDPPTTITYARCIFNVLDVSYFYEDLSTCGTYAQLRSGGVILLQETYESLETKLLPDRPNANQAHTS